MRASRRSFLTAAAGVVPAMTVAAPVVQPARRDGPQTRLKLGTVTYNIAATWDINTIIARLTDIGIEGVELRTTHAHGVEPRLGPAERADVRKRFENSPVQLAGLGTVCEYHAADPGVLRKNIDETKAWVTLARDLGCPSVKVRPNGLRSDVSEEQSLAQIGRALEECGAFALDHGIRIQLEVHGRDTARLPRIRRILDHADNQPAVWVCWNSNPEDLLDGGLEANFNLVRSRIGQVHMRDLFLEEYPSRRLLQLLNEMSFEGFCFAEIPESADPVRVLKYFRGMFRAYQNII